ncbi:adenylate/guanylate cyclase domain-containing protein [Lutimonas halocynthiae]|nr:adenylate/guanylate cyclase domain-containing protein [Lutimonas halocynthiae]
MVITMAFFLTLCASIFAQNQNPTDSLETIIRGGNYDEANKLNLLKQLSVHHPNPEKKLAYANELLTLAMALDSTLYISAAYLEKGNALFQKGDFSLAIDSYLEYGKTTGFEESNEEIVVIYGTMAMCYEGMGDSKMAIKYYQRAINIPEIEKDTILLATNLENLGYTYLVLKLPDSALIYFNKSGLLFKEINHEIGLAYNLANKGAAWAQLKNFEKAELNIHKSIETLEEYGHHRALCDVLIESSEIYFLNEKFDLASEFANRGLDIAKANNFKPQISAANLQLSKIYEKLETDNQSLDFYKDYIVYRDSIRNPNSIQEIANMRADFEVSLKQTEVDLKQSELDLNEAKVILLNEQKSNQRLLILTMVVILGMTGLYYWNIHKEKRKSDDLLLNILPKKTAEELKENGMVKAKKFESVTIMFTDFQAFTKYSHTLSPEVLVRTVDYYFSKFDEIIEKYSLEKIKTIGDAYMCAGGLNSESPDHHLKIVKAAFEISEFIKESKFSDLGEMAHFDIRIGINTGPVVAGVVGKKKFAYDIWGDSVNVASRMESNSQAGRINVSENTYQLIKNEFHCEYRGEIEVKNKGLMKMYFVESSKVTSVINDTQIKPKSIKKTTIPI